MKSRSKKPGEKLVARMPFGVRLLVFIALLSLNLYTPNLTQAAVPTIINFQGRLYDENDNLLGGAGTDFCFKFGIWDVGTGGSANPNQIWPGSFADPSIMTIVVRNGVFDAYVGDTGAGGDALTFDFQSDDEVYVDVQVSEKMTGSCTAGGDEVFETLDPRPRIVASGYAINSKTVGGFTPAQSATDSQIPVLTTGGILLSHATTARLASVGTAPLAVDGGSSGALNLNNTSTGDILMGGGSGTTGCTLTNSSGAFACRVGISSGVAGASIGAFNLSGNTSGTISILPQAAAGTYNFNLPTTAGNSGEVLTSGGGTTNAMTWTAPGALAVRWNSLVDPTGDQTLAFDDGEQNIWTMNSDTENFWSISAPLLTTGQVLNIAHITTVIADGGSLVRLSSTSNDTGGATNGTLLDLSSTAATAATLMKITNNTAAFTGISQSISNTGQTTGTGLSITGGGANLAAGGELVDLQMGAAVAGNGINVTTTGAYTGTGLATLTADSLTSGTMLNLSSNGTGGLTNQKGINVSLTGANGTGGQTTYGGYFSNTHSGTTPTNVGLYATASGGTNNYAGIFESGSVGIGTTAPAQKLTVSDGVILSNYGTNSTPTELGGAALSRDANTVFVSGKYAYVGLDDDAGAGNELQIFDIHNPASIPASVGGVSITNDKDIYTINVTGNYAYVGTEVDGSGNELRVYDITNPSSPSLAGSVDVAEDVTSIFVVGRYLYLTKTDNSGTCSGTTLTGCEFSIYDVIDPSSPTAIGGEDFVDSSTHYRGNSVYVQGKYAFIGRDTSTGTCSGTTVTGCEFIIYDISNPFDPSPQNGVNVAKEVNSVFASGAYAYIGTDSGTGNEFSIYEVSDATSIGAEVGGLEVGADVNSVTNYGKYAYIGANAVSGNDFRIIDVTAPASPSAVGGVDTSIAVHEVFVSGKYLYTAFDLVSGNEFRAYDISGVDAPSATIGSLAAGALNVTDNAQIWNDLSVGNAINVGVGGMQSLGSVTIANSTIGDSSPNSVAGFHGLYTFNPTAGGTQVGNRFVITNSPTSSANTAVGQIVRVNDTTSLANTVRGIEIVANVGGNTAGTNTGLRATGATFGVQGFSNGLAGGVSLPAALYGESTGTTQGDILRLFSSTMTSASAMAQIYHDTSTFTGAAILIDMAVGSGGFTGNFLDFQENNVQRFLVTDQGVTSMGLSGTASTTAVCSSLANTTAPTAGTAYEIRDCSGAPAADYAEMYPVSEGAEFGDIVATGTEMVNTYDTVEGNIDWTKIKGKVTKLVKSERIYQGNVIGIVSDNFGDFTSAGYNIKEEDNPMPIALNGRVPVNVAPDSEAILPGDYLTTSLTPGKAMKAGRAGQVVGKALEPWTPGGGEASVMIFVEQGYYNGQEIEGSTELAVTEPIDPNAPVISTDSPADRVIEEFLASEPESQMLELNVAELFADRLIVGLEIITPLLSASVVNAGSLNVSNDANFAGLTFFSDSAEFSGSTMFNSEVEFKLSPSFNKDTAGFALVHEGDKSVRVLFEEPYAMTPIVTASMTFEATDNIDEAGADSILSQNITSLVIDKSATGFTILLNKRAPQNIRFSWIALGVKDAKVFESLGEGLEFLTPNEPEPEMIESSAPEPAPAPIIISSEPESETIPEPEPISESEPEIISEPTPEPTVEPEPELVVEPVTAEGGTPQEAVEPEPQPEADQPSAETPEESPAV